ncbi:hypothetical protein DKX38_026332 [Salix brachista]|uniref:Protein DETOXIFICATION n=1 Tax=Salix brachista TaxID=2182728 RepID=A0A5N5JWD2_9ROSI|nr:hypothetical protein DKX38_026332 [Salix brachista]
MMINLNINGLELMLFLEINAAISVRVSNELGLGHPEAAKYSVYVTVFQSLVIGLVCMAVVLVAKDYFAYIFTSSKLAAQCCYPLTLHLRLLMTPVGVAIGGGWQAMVAYINIGCYYVFGLPLGFLLGYKANLGVEIASRKSAAIREEVGFVLGFCSIVRAEGESINGLSLMENRALKELLADSVHLPVSVALYSSDYSLPGVA